LAVAFLIAPILFFLYVPHNKLMSMKSQFLTTLLSFCLFFIFCAATAEAGEIRTAEFSYKCLGNGEYKVTVKVPVSDLQNIRTYCKITVVPDQAPAARFVYHLNKLESPAPFNGDINTMITTAKSEHIVFSRVLNLGVYKSWNSFTLRYEDKDNMLAECEVMKGFHLDLHINTASGVCVGSSTKQDIPCPPKTEVREVTVVVSPKVNERPIYGCGVNKKVLPVSQNPVTIRTAPTQVTLIEPLKMPFLFISPDSRYISEEVIANSGSVEGSGSLETKSPLLTPGLLLYPNPSEGNVQLQLSNAPDKTFSLQVFDIGGRKVAEASGIGSDHLIERNNLKPGVYKVMMIGNLGGVYSGTVVWH
jgi:hypothetical protein